MAKELKEQLITKELVKLIGEYEDYETGDFSFDGFYEYIVGKYINDTLYGQ